MNGSAFFIAAAVSLAAFFIHTFVGGARVARPLLADKGLPKASKWLNYYCWHIATALLLAMTGSFAYAALNPVGADVAMLMTALAAILSALSAWVAVKGGVNPLRFPSTSLFAVAAAFGAAGLALH